jgi:Domain found in IF2B/IF5
MNLPAPVGTLTGKGTTIVNLREAMEVLGRPLEHLARFMAWQVPSPPNTRTSVVIYPTCVCISSPLTPEAPQQLLVAYIEKCMRCPACKGITRGLDGTCTQCNAQTPDPVPPEVWSQVAEVLDD